MRPTSGGCISYIDLFWGTKKFVEEADRLADTYGDRFRPNKLLRDMAAKGETFYERFGAKTKAALPRHKIGKGRLRADARASE
ncbi:MAG: hypothetical protein IPL62_03755 [Caulobacteraceae bacterium]|nr:hypothetical protein [Caulobacteraceae bacterium]